MEAKRIRPGVYQIQVSPEQARKIGSFVTDQIDAEYLELMPKGMNFHTLNEIRKYETDPIPSEADAAEHLQFIAHMITILIDTGNDNPVLLYPLIYNSRILKAYLKADTTPQDNWLQSYYISRKSYIDAKTARDRLNDIRKPKGNF